MKPIPFSLSLLSAGLLAGCMNLAPAYDRPEAPVAPAWPAVGGNPATLAPAGSVAAPAAEIAWRDFFIDRRLRQVVELTLANNRDLRIALLNIDRARAAYGIQQASQLPAVGANGSGSVSHGSGDLSATGSGSTSRQYSATLAMSAFELDFFGRVKNLSEAALQSYLATEQSQRSTQISLLAEVANAWLTLSADQSRLALAQETLKSQQRSYELSQRLRELGAASGLDLVSAQTTVDSARADVAGYTAQVAQDRNALVLLVGGELPDDLLPGTIEAASADAADGPASSTISALVAVPADLPSSVLQQRPDVLAAEHTLRASNADIGAARAAFFPRITLTAATGTASDKLSGLFRAGNGIWSFAPAISLPIFDGGANRAQLESAKAEQAIQVATYEKALQTAFREVADVLATRATLGERLAAQQSLTDATRKVYELTQARQRSGADSALDVLSAQRSLYSAQQNLITLLLSEQSSRITLYKVLGGGWS